ncbi:MAG: hypothetical protein IPN29_18545 [Saprospiraceae bacterium]|nr:hypothetical protein [Saprospiraceae bacterium]
MRKFTLAFALSIIATCTFAQLVNDGATITIKNGAVLYVESDVTNNGAGIISIEGTGVLEVQGHLTNNATLTMQPDSKLKFSGAGNSNFNSNGAIIKDLEIAKNNGTVTLLDTVTVDSLVNFTSATSSKLLIANKYLILGSGASISGFDADEYVVTTGSGVIQKNFANGVYTNQAFTFPVGDATNYSPLSSTFSGTATSANLKSKVNNVVHPSKPADATDFIARYWEIDATGFTGYTNTLTGTYASGDVTGTAAKVKGAVYDITPEWSYTAAATNGTSTVTGITDDAIADFTGTNFFGKANLKLFLTGPFNAAADTMRTNLNLLTGVNILGKFAVNSPYTDAAAAVVDSAFFPQHPKIVDWVKLEVFPSGTTNFATSNAISKVSALLLSTGEIVSPSYTSLPRIKDGDVNSIVKLVHRNHLPIRTISTIPLDQVSPALVDFTTGTSTFFNNASGNNPMKLINTKNTLWEGNVNSIKNSDAASINANVDHSVNVLDLGLTKTNTTATALNIYSIFDVNLDKNKNVLDFGTVKSATTITKTADL